MDALMRILAPEIEEEKRNNIKNYASEIVGRMIKSGSDNSYISYITNVPENEIESLRSSMNV